MASLSFTLAEMHVNQDRMCLQTAISSHFALILVQRYGAEEQFGSVNRLGKEEEASLLLRPCSLASKPPLSVSGQACHTP